MDGESFERFKRESTYSETEAAELRRRGFWGEMAWSEYLEDNAETRGDHPSVVDDRRTLTWAELRDLAHRFAAALAERGVEPGDRVAHQVPHRFEYHVARHGIARAGAIQVPFGMRHREHEMRALAENVQPTAYVGEYDYKDYGHVETARELAETIPTLETVVAIDGPDEEGITPFEDFIDVDLREFSPRHVHPDYPTELDTTTGSSGTPKAAYSSQNARICNIRDAVNRAQLTERDTIMTLAPLQSTTGNYWAYYAPLLLGATSIVPRCDDTAEYWTALERHEPSCLCAVPTQMTKMTKERESDRRGALEPVRMVICPGEPLPTEVGAFFEERGSVPLNLYGSSEGGAASMGCSVDSREERFSTAGKPLFTMDVAVVGADGTHVDDEEEGEIIFGGPGGGAGYLRDKEMTREAFDVGGPNEGWYHSGDVGRFDERGNLVVVGRLDDMILRGGQNVFPQEIEDAILELDPVDEVAVIGMPDEEYGERICAYVVATDPEALALGTIVDHLDGIDMAKYKWPEHLELADDLPTIGGKTDRTALKEDIAQKLSDSG